MTNFTSSNRTDLASELIKSKFTDLNEHVSITEVTVTENDAKKIGKPAGEYVTLLSPVVSRGEKEYYRRLIKAMTESIKTLVFKPQTCLVVGLGNPNMTADALGKLVVDKIRVNRGIDDDIPQVCTLCPSVLGVTGVESFDVVSGVAHRIKPDLIIAVDSLCAASPERLCTAFQLTDTGIAPGSGVSNYRFRIDKNTMSAPVLSIGVPLVVYASTFSGEKLPDDMIVTPKDIDLIVEDCAFVIAESINGALK